MIKIYPSYFFISFFITIFICYLTLPKPNIIIKNPTPEFSGKKLNQNCKENECFRYKNNRMC